MTITYYRRVPLHTRLLAPLRRVFISRGTLSRASRLELWESEGGALESPVLHPPETAGRLRA